MKRFLSSLLLISFLLVFSFVMVQKSSSDEIDDITKQINDLTNAMNMSIKATQPLESQLIDMQKQITQIEQRVSAIEADIAAKKVIINQEYADVAKKQLLLNQTIKDFYIKSSYDSPLMIFLSGASASHFAEIMAYQRAAENQDKAIITDLALSIIDLETKKQNLETEQNRLTAVKADLDTQSAKLNTIVAGAKAYQAVLSNQIAQLSAKQQALLAQKLGSLNLPTSAYAMHGGCTDDRTIDPGFSPRFAMFTYGVPNRVGMSQYGAWGRAKAGQNENTILHAYYNFDNYQNVSTNINIRVNDSNGFNSGNIIWSGNLEDYVKRIYEMPDSWTDNNLAALKAQAIAARSYVLAATNNGASSICANENCQAFQTNPKGGNWDQAVNQTSGKVMVQGGQPIKAWFSSTHGGYEFTSGDIGWSNTPWTKRQVDATGSINSFSDLQNNAYDKDSPVFYCDWGSRADYNKTAWLKPEELADIVNVLMLAKADSSTQDHLSQTDKPNPDGVDTWDADRVKQELRNRNITPFNSVSDVAVDANFGSGQTTTVHISGDGQTQSFNGNDFKNYFNLRAPSNINIVGPLYNVEKR